MFQPCVRAFIVTSDSGKLYGSEVSFSRISDADGP
jgi:hypothetical protein